MSVLVTKADGTTEPFLEEKLKNSLAKAGADNNEINTILQHLEPIFYDGIKTQVIYEKAFEELAALETPKAARYSLRRALFGLGPTGFPFEKFLARVFAAEGYTTENNLTIDGHCASHEIDIIGYNEEDSFVAEAKFHARPGIKSDLQVAMYSYARKLDLVGKKSCNRDICGIKDFMLITNTKFTTTAEKYAECVGVKLLSWSYPEGDTLHDRISRTGLYPVTVIQNLNTAQKRALIDRGIITCQDLVRKPQMLRHCHINTQKIEAVIFEASQLCGN